MGDRTAVIGRRPLDRDPRRSQQRTGTITSSLLRALNPKGPHPGSKRRRFDPEQFRSPAGPVHLPVRLLECTKYILPLPASQLGF